MNHDASMLCLDIGSGTQDALLFLPDRELENCPKFVLPSPALQVAQRIRSLTRKRSNVFLFGTNMGGGFRGALSEHIQSGLGAAAHPEAAYSLGDDPERVAGMGLQISATCPEGYVAVHLADYEPGFWNHFLSLLGLEPPSVVLAAAQDHGHHPGESNRKGRFRIWKELLGPEGLPVQELLFDAPPAPFTRLQALQSSKGGGPVADTGAAAALGALYVPEIEAENRQRGICVVNVGNSHTIGFLLYAGRVLGIYEHHTQLLNPEKLWSDLALFRRGELDEASVFADQGHGCMVCGLPQEADGFDPVYVLGPNRSLLQGFPVDFPAPGGDMMLAGCFGLLKGWQARRMP